MVKQIEDFSRKFHLTGIILAVLLVVASGILLAPIIWMVFASLRPLSETFGSPPAWFPKDINFDAYRTIFLDPRQQRYQVNSWIISLSTAFLSVSLGVMAAYGFSRFKIRGANFILLAILALQMLPGVSIIIPFVQLARWAGIWDTYLAMILANTAFALAISIWLLKGYVDSIPIDLEEAAMVDGCTRFQAFYRIVLPLLAPGLVGTATFAFLYAWNDFIFATVLRNGQELMPMTVAIGNFFTSHSRDWTSIMALNTMATVPVFILFILLQRWVIQGMTAGAVK